MIQKLSERQNAPWRYPSKYTPGALRLMLVEPLLSSSSSRIFLYEFPHIQLDQVCANSRRSIPKYLAISHVWNPSSAVASRRIIRSLYITIRDGEQEISWLGLMQAALAAKHLECQYIWLDFVCLDQISPRDKSLQIMNMSNIYANCSATVVMPGGVRAAQRLEDDSNWITRAWTLQEAVESARRRIQSVRYALFEWPYEGYVPYGTWCFNFKNLNEGVAILPVRELLSMHGPGGLPIVPGGDDSKEHKCISINCFGNRKEVVAPLLRLLFENTESDTELWRSLWVRTSSKQHDILFSAMNLFSTRVPLQVNYSQSFDTLLLQFIRGLHEKAYPPYWLKIGHRIPTYPWSGLFPMPPTFEAHNTPTYTVQNRRLDAHDLLCEQGCCGDIDLSVEVIGASWEEGHILCGKMMKVVRCAKTNTHPVYTGRCWQHVRKILISYTPGDQRVDMSRWTIAVDADAIVKDSNSYIRFERDKTPLNPFELETDRPYTPPHERNQLWHRSHTKGADLSCLRHPYPTTDSINLTALCFFDGNLGPYLTIVGYFNSHFQNPVVYFFDRTEVGNIQRVGTGKLLLKERIKSDIPWRHLRVGGRPSTTPAIERCSCLNKKEVPLIEEREIDPRIRTLAPTPTLY